VSKFYRHGWHSWSPTGWFETTKPVDEPTDHDLIINYDHPDHTGQRVWSGSGVGAMKAEDHVNLLGSLALGARVRARPEEMEPVGGGDWLALRGGRDEVFSKYLDAFADRWGSRKGDVGPIWCSWYSFGQDIDQESMLQTLRDVEELSFRVFQLDAGWERMLGDWQPNQKFPDGMTAMAERISARGFDPGIWLAPFAAHRRSELIAKHPEFLLRDRSGNSVRFSHNWGDDGLALDVTRSDVLDFVAETIIAVVGWGFRYLKLDFLYAGAFPGVRHGTHQAEEGYRQAMEVVRKSAGEGVYLLACGAPVLPSIGVCDGIRVGPDTAPFWEDHARVHLLGDGSCPGARNALVTSLHRLWLAPAIGVDPDVAFFRSRYNLLTPVQRQLGQDLAVISGFRATSDPPAWLDREEAEQLQAFLEAKPTIERIAPYRWDLDGREVDFARALELDS